MLHGRCGDGILRSDLQPGDAGYEECDDANADNTDACVSECVSARCGDGHIQVGIETCDDGNAVTERCPYGERACRVCDATRQEVPGDSNTVEMVS